MKLEFPAMRGLMGKREFFVAMMKLKLVPRLFRFRDWAELPAEQRAQRVIQKSRIPEITQYILDNEDGYLFSSLTASYSCEPNFKPVSGHEDMGVLEIPFEADLMINDGQHRRAAIEEALQMNPALGDETISVVLFPWEDLDRMQQMFSDLNRTARKTSKSLDILYNHRDVMSQVTLAVIEKVDVFRNSVDRDRVSLPLRSPKLFTLGSLYDSNTGLLGLATEEDFDEKVDLAIKYWDAVSNSIPEWRQVRDGDLKPHELRQEFIHSTAVMVWAIGAMGHTLISTHPNDWESRLTALRSIDFRRTNREWQGITMNGNDVVNRRQNRKDTAAFLKLKFGLPLTDSEERSLKGATEVIDDLRRLLQKREPSAVEEVN